MCVSTTIEQTPVAGRAARVLVAEDDDAMRSFLVRTLLATGYDVQKVRSSQELGRYLERVANRADDIGDSPIDLIVSDMATLVDSSLRDIARGRRFPILVVSNNGTSFASGIRFNDVEIEGIASKRKPAAMMVHIEKILKYRSGLRLKQRFTKILKCPYTVMAILTPRQVSKRYTQGHFLFY